MTIFEEQAKKNPNQIAAEFSGKIITYHQLNNKANQLSRYIQQQLYQYKGYSLKPDDLIAICVERSLDMLIGILAILKAGSAYVPIDPNYPENRISYILSDTKTPLMLSQSQIIDNFAQIISKILPTVILLDKVDYQHLDTNNAKPISEAKNLAYVIYTSGTTGYPKGVLINHQGVVNTLYPQVKLWNFGTKDRILQISSLSFDASVLEIFAALLSGASIILAAKNTLFSGETLAKTLIEHKISVAFFTPMILNMLPKVVYPYLHTLLIGGEACSLELMRHWSNDYRCIHLYGPTEVSIFSSAMIFSSNTKLLTLGKPISNMEIYILDNHLQLLPIGIIGEIYIAGVGLARGYLNLSKLTKAHFIVNPFANDSDHATSTYLYKTGDLARWLPDGNLEYIGRNDNQIKIRGIRIELNEIEEQLLLFENLGQATLLTKEYKQQTIIVAYLVFTQKPILNIQKKLYDFIKNRLPTYMIPNNFVILKTMPLTINGKIDKNALLNMPIAPSAFVNDYKLPKNETERKLQNIWEDILAIKSLNTDDNFFALGGNSLLLIPLVVQIEKIFNKKIPVSLIFSHPTIEQLATFITGEEFSLKSSAIIRIQTLGHKIPIFAVHPGSGIIFRYLLLSKYLGNEQPFYGIQDPTIGQSFKFKSLEEMANCYIKAMKTVQPKGPYILCGYCMSGFIIYEMAKQLIEKNEMVAELIMLDCPTSYAINTIQEKPFKNKLHFWGVYLRRWLIYQILKFFKPLLYFSKSKLMRYLQHQFEGRYRLKLLTKYSFTTFSGSASLIKSCDYITESDDNGWKEFIPNLKIYPFSAKHENMTEEPHVQALANCIKNILMRHNKANVIKDSATALVE